MSTCIKLNSMSTKQLTIICSLIAIVTTIGVVLTIKIRNGSPNLLESNIQEYAHKINSTKPQWIKFVDKDKSLLNAFIAGTNIESEPIYVCRVNRSGAIVPGTYSSRLATCQVTYGYYTIKHYEYEILIAEDHSSFVWQDSNYENAPNGALIGGINHSKDEFKLAKVVFGNGDQQIGRVDWITNEALVSDGENELKFMEYKVLCLKDYSLV